MTDLFGSEDQEESSGSKENFVGRVVDSAVTVEDLEVDVSDNMMESSGKYETDIDVLYIVEPLTEYTDTDRFYELGLNMAKSPASKWQIFVGHIENMTGKSFRDLGIETAEDLCDWLKGRTFEFRDFTFDEDEEFEWELADRTINIRREFQDMDNKPNPMMIPVRHIDEDELAEMDLEDEDSEPAVDDSVEF